MKALRLQIKSVIKILILHRKLANDDSFITALSF